MKKFFLCILLLGCSPLHAAKKVFTFNPASYTLPDFKCFLDSFFQDPDVQDFFLHREKWVKLDHVQVKKLQENHAKSQAFLEKIARITQQNPHYKNLQSIIFKKYNISDLGINNYVLNFNQYPQYLLKLPKYDWPLKFQNISRVFYAQQRKNFIKKEALKKFKPIQKYLYKIRPAIEKDGYDEKNIPLEDTYFAVITEFVPNLQNKMVEQLHEFVHTQEFHSGSISKLLRKLGWFGKKLMNLFKIKTKKHLAASSHENEERLVELLKYMTGNHVWHIKDIFIDEDDCFVDVDTEESGLDAWRGPEDWNRTDHCIERFGLEEKLNEKGKKEKERKIKNERDCGLGQLQKLFKKIQSN